MWMDTWVDGGVGGWVDLQTSPKQALLFPISQANDMTFLPEKNKMPTECRTPTWGGEGLSFYPKPKTGHGPPHASILTLPPSPQLKLKLNKTFSRADLVPTCRPGALSSL